MAGTFGLAAPSQTLLGLAVSDPCAMSILLAVLPGERRGPNKSRWTTNLPGQPGRVAQPYRGFRRLLFSAGFSDRAHRFFTRRRDPPSLIRRVRGETLRRMPDFPARDRTREWRRYIEIFPGRRMRAGGAPYSAANEIVDRS
jgi:hypothetical protein